MMNLEKLFKTQDVLDEKIYDRFPELKEQNWDWKFTALYVELGECANEWRGFKKWKKEREPRTREITVQCDLCQEWTEYTHEVEGITRTRYPLLEEYVDGLHFVLSIGLEIGANQYKEIGLDVKRKKNIEQQFNAVFMSVTDVLINVQLNMSSSALEEYKFLFAKFMTLGEMLGFTPQEIEQAYFDKNAINHQRQEAGY